MFGRNEEEASEPINEVLDLVVSHGALKPSAASQRGRGAGRESLNKT